MKKAFVVALTEEIDGLQEINNIPVFYTGLGKLNAILTSSRLICEGFTEIINIGSCGSKNLKSGTLVKVGKTFEDIDATPIFDYGKSKKNDLDFINIDSDSEFSCFTTDYFFDHNQPLKYSKNYLLQINKSSVFDMECFAHAKVCHQHNIKFNAYKWVSDDGDFNSWNVNCKIGFDNFIKNYNL
jgi:adenosylhomocysteine nucleosidase